MHGLGEEPRPPVYYHAVLESLMGAVDVWYLFPAFADFLLMSPSPYTLPGLCPWGN